MSTLLPSLGIEGCCDGAKECDDEISSYDHCSDVITVYCIL